MKKTTLDATIIGQKFYTIVNNRIMAEKVTKVTFMYPQDNNFWHYHIPILHLKRVDGRETMVRLNWDYQLLNYQADREYGYYTKHPLYQTPDDASSMEQAIFELPSIPKLVRESGLGWVNWENLDAKQKNYSAAWGNCHSQPLSRCMWNGVCAVETYRWLFIVEINKEGVSLGISDPFGHQPYLVVSPDATRLEEYYSRHGESICCDTREGALKTQTWLKNTYPTKVECSNANKIVVVDFDD